jgi:hypothetical protein
VVILIELTCCAEEGIGAAQLRKETRYAELLEEIKASNKWKASLFTVEIGARGLVGSRTYHAFVTLGIPPTKANKLCKLLSIVSARCSYAIYLAHKDTVWHKKIDLVVVDDNDGDVASDPEPPVPTTSMPRTIATQKPSDASVTNIVHLRNQGIKVLYHFTDAANLESVRKNGLMSASSLQNQDLPSVMNSSELSRKLDRSKGLQDYVRLSFNDKNPMLFKALKEKRISKLVMLEIKLEVVSRPGVLFFDRNAAKTGALQSTSPDIVRFDVVKASSHFAVDENLKQFYQAEVLVPSPVPPHLIVFPDDPKPKAQQKQSAVVRKSLITRAPVPTADVLVSAEPLVHSKVSQPRLAGTSPSVVLVRCNNTNCLPSFVAPSEVSQPRLVCGIQSNPDVSQPRPTVSESEVSQQRPAHPCLPPQKKEYHCLLNRWKLPQVEKPSRPTMPLSRSMPCLSLKDELQHHRNEKLRECLKLTDPVYSCDEMPLWYMLADITSKMPSKMTKRVPESGSATKLLRCEMPLSSCNTCDTCIELGQFMNCMNHMKLCNADDIFLGCENCSRVLCPKHMMNCYCRQFRPPKTKRVSYPLKSKTSPGSRASRGRSN